MNSEMREALPKIIKHIEHNVTEHPHKVKRTLKGDDTLGSYFGCRAYHCDLCPIGNGGDHSKIRLCVQVVILEDSEDLLTYHLTAQKILDKLRERIRGY